MLYGTFLALHPQQLEVDAIELIMALHRRYPTLWLRIVHLSTADALLLNRAAQQSGLSLVAEMCFHYLCLDATRMPNSYLTASSVS
ncbi:hypothetical protein WOLCODRAFT_152695 [Wolfiporia cocos MD-104 SS10]|uniref:Uncharacterized protein n=1 Tax=Wolfiporia cocos (strain MD-104) TaxID=742152 RepID=A0A2H3JXT0_WOLCO|nr:hypothetical protein WOLCODRAFT_152695 [Wolfiporia cocos MD-104 SS10]